MTFSFFYGSLFSENSALTELRCHMVHLRKVVLVIWFVIVILGAFSWSRVFASEGEHHPEVGVLGQVSVRHLNPSVGVYGLIPLIAGHEVHASAWTNPMAATGGLGTGTLHTLGHSMWLGWEAAIDLEHDGALVYGLGPVFEYEVMQHRLHTYLKVPLEYGHSFGWATIAGLSVAIWH